MTIHGYIDLFLTCLWTERRVTGAVFTVVLVHSCQRAADAHVQGYYSEGSYASATVYPSAGLPTSCFPYCGPGEPYSQPLVMVKLSGVKLGVKTATVCSAHVAVNIGDALSTLQQRDRLASTNFAFTIHSHNHNHTQTHS